MKEIVEMIEDKEKEIELRKIEERKNLRFKIKRGVRKAAHLKDKDSKDES